MSSAWYPANEMTEKQSLVFLNVLTMAQPEAFIGGAAKLFDDDCNIANETTREFLQKFMRAFAAWVAEHTAP